MYGRSPRISSLASFKGSGDAFLIACDSFDIITIVEVLSKDKVHKGRKAFRFTSGVYFVTVIGNKGSWPFFGRVR